MRYHTQRKIWSDQIASDDSQRMAAWDRQANPDDAYDAHGWSAVLENADPYDGSPVIGGVVRSADVSAGTWSGLIDGKPWRDAIDIDEMGRLAVEAETEAARQQAIDAVNQVRAASIAAGISIILPPGSTLDGDDASGQTVRLHLDGHPVTDYWDKVGQAVQLGTASPTFDSMDGRVVVQPEHMLTICKIVGAAKSKAFTATRNAERAIELGKYSDVLAMAQAFAAAGSPAAVDVAAVTASA